MSKVLLSEVEEAVEHILGKDTYGFLCDRQMTFAYAVNLAITRCFIDNLSGPAVEILRAGAKELEAKGRLTNDED